MNKKFIVSAIFATIFGIFLISSLYCEEQSQDEQEFQVANAVPAAPSPTCEITAKVLKIEETKTVTPAILQPSEEIEHYRVKLEILEISTYRQEGSRSCDDSYIKTAEESGQILTLKEYNENPIFEGHKIKAKINFGGDERFGGYFLSDIQILQDNVKK